ncbi:MAG: hypothetical protein IJH63_16335 [Methanobrevibacter sp.]|uniref:Uncharacterized protein n=1 Tax=Methanobrevibacter millerae TaxID=230361 RepID=A0A8T3V854_9EURY|nr:hypothetical protein [Methanobrevibacter millerae]MBR0372252.1 hypothetical protein [Methanobrevibacter sp.]
MSNNCTDYCNWNCKHQTESNRYYK